MNNIAIIPARGGSKRIPHKNIKPFGGKPIISYSINAAKKSNLFKRIIVSTDSEKIAKVSRAYGAEVPFMRPPEISDDYTHVSPVIHHALQWLLNNGEIVEYICCILATAPLLESKYICRGYELIKDRNATSAIAVTAFPYPIFRAYKINNAGRIEMVWPENFDTRSQDWPETYQDACQFFWANAKKFLKEKTFLTSDTIPVKLPRYMVQDIDTLEDWKSAEVQYELLELAKSNSVASD